MLTPVILFRKDYNTEREMEIASRYFPVVEYRNAIPKNSLVVGRYSVLPFYKELSGDVFYRDSELVNSWLQHSYIADLGSWYEDLKEFTFYTIPHRELCWQPDRGYQWVVKGQTNSRKDKWRTKMFAENNRQATEVALELMDDGLICDQKIYCRKYEKLRTYLHGINGQPITEEYRFFMYRTTVLASGFYWASHTADVLDLGIPMPNPDVVPREFLAQVACIVSQKANFYVMDIARREDGSWVLVELNDGQMSGLSEIDPDELYRNLRKALDEQK